MNTTQEIASIIKSHIGNVNSFVDAKGKNHLPLIIKELDTLFANRIWIIAADILKTIGVKRIRTSYIHTKAKKGT